MSSSGQSVDEFILCLANMGFEIEDAQQAVQAGKLQVDDAIEWILGGKPKPQTQQPGGAGRLRLGVHSGQVGSNPFSEPEQSKPKPIEADAPGSNQKPAEEESIQSRHHMKDDQREIKERFEEKQRLEARKHAVEEKKAAKKAKDQILKQIQEDREMKKLRRGGASASAGKAEDTPESTQQATSSQAEPTPPKQESALLQIRLPNGTVLKQTFTPTTPLAEVWTHVQQKFNDWRSYCLMQPFPRREYGEAEMSETLSSLGLVPSGSLVMKRLEKPMDAAPGDPSPSLPVQDTQAPATPPSAQQPPPFQPPVMQPPPFQPPVMQPPPAAHLPMFPPPGPPGGPPMMPMPPPGLGHPPNHQWGSGNKLGGEDEEGDQEPVEAGEQPIPPPPDHEEDMDTDSDEDDMPPGLGGPGMGPPGMMPPQWGQGHLWGDGQALVGEVIDPEDNLPHHRKDPKELAAEAARKRFDLRPAVPMEEEPSTSRTSLAVIPKLVVLVIQHISTRICDTRHPITGMHGVPADVAILVLQHLMKEGLLRPKTLQPFVSCHLPRLVLNSYKYTTNELLAVVRYHRHLNHLGLASCSLINDNGVASIQGLTRLKHLNLGSNPQLTNKIVSVIIDLPNLVTLVLEGTGITDAGVSALAEAAPAHIQNLDLSRTEVTQVVLPALRALPSLRSLNLEQTKIQGLSGIQGMTNLQMLNVSNTPLVTDSLLCLRDHPSITALNISNTLNIEGDLALQYLSGMKLQYLGLPNRLTTTDSGLQYISGMPLQLLDLTNYNNITNVGAQHIGRITSLRKLRLSNTKITDEGMLFLGGLRELEELFLDRTAVTDAGVEIIRDFSRLQELSLSETGISDQLLKKKTLGGCVLLSKLNLSRTSITNKGIVHLWLPHLTLLNLDVTMVTEENVQSLPGCPQLVKISAKNLQPLPMEEH